MSATAQQLLDETNAAILAVTEAIATGAGTVEYMIGNRRHRKTDPALILPSLYRARAELLKQVNGGGRPRVTVASLARPGGRS